MTWTSPSTVATGDTITASLWNTYVRDNSNHLRGMLPDPGAAGMVPYSNSSTTAVWTAIASLVAAGASGLDLADIVAALGYTPLNKAGDTAGGQIIAPSFEINTGGSFWQWIASGGSMFIGIPGLINPIELTSSAVKLTGMVTVNGTALNSVPSGLIAAFATAAAIASGWSRYTALDGRMPVGAGTVFSTTFVENTDYGSSWGHIHAANSFPLTSFASGGPTGTNSAGDATGGGTHGDATSTHTHQTATGAAGGDSSSASWVIPSHAVVWAQKS